MTFWWQNSLKTIKAWTLTCSHQSHPHKWPHFGTNVECNHWHLYGRSDRSSPVCRYRCSCWHYSTHSVLRWHMAVNKRTRFRCMCYGISYVVYELQEIIRFVWQISRTGLNLIWSDICQFSNNVKTNNFLLLPAWKWASLQLHDMLMNTDSCVIKGPHYVFHVASTSCLTRQDRCLLRPKPLENSTTIHKYQESVLDGIGLYV